MVTTFVLIHDLLNTFQWNLWSFIGSTIIFSRKGRNVVKSSSAGELATVGRELVTSAIEILIASSKLGIINFLPQRLSLSGSRSILVVLLKPTGLDWMEVGPLLYCHLIGWSLLLATVLLRDMRKNSANVFMIFSRAA